MNTWSSVNNALLCSLCSLLFDVLIELKPYDTFVSPLHCNFIHSSSVSTSSWSYQQIWLLTRKRLVSGGNTPWVGHQSIALSRLHLGTIEVHLQQVFGRWEETKEPRGNSHRHGENMWIPRQAEIWAQDWTINPGSVNSCTTMLTSLDICILTFSLYKMDFTLILLIGTCCTL